MSISKEVFGKNKGKVIDLYTIKNAKGNYAQVISYGACLQSLCIADKNNNLIDLILGFDDLESHLTLSDFQGQTVGRYANRIAKGQFEMDGKLYKLTQNEENGNCLHGGGEFSHAVWDYLESDESSVTLSYLSPKGAHGFPGEVKAKVKYSFTDQDELIIDFHAKSDEKTPINLTNHAYFNLAGSGHVLNHMLTINADFYTPTDSDNIPTGELKSVLGTPFDFRKSKRLADDIGADDDQLKNCRGYDHNFCLNDSSDGSPAAIAYCPESGIKMELFTDLPGVQLYTGNFLKEIEGKGGKKMGPHHGFCLETQYYPVTPNQAHFPQCFFKAGQAFVSKSTFAFSLV